MNKNKIDSIDLEIKNDPYIEWLFNYFEYLSKVTRIPREYLTDTEDEARFKQ